MIGASAARQTQGNGVIRNLRQVGYAGRIIPVHPTAAEIDGLAAVGAIDHLPPGIDTAVVAIPAPAVVGVLAALQQAGVRSAVVFSNGFPGSDEQAYRELAADSAMAIHGPNCMGLINLTEPLRLYPSTVTEKVTRGRVALIAQSGSAAISLINSLATGLSKVITMGSEWQVTAPDYMRWLATDAATAVIGVVLESIKDPAAFAAAATMLREAGKPLVVLKVGRSTIGAAAVKAHTGAMISPSDAYDCFFESCGIPTVRDYDEMVATLECFATCRARPRGRRTGIIGISGGETALACDIASDQGLALARWGRTTEERVCAALPGAAGVNPLDLGATPNHTVEQDDGAIAAILDDPEVDQLLVVQDCQATLTPTMRGNYTPRIASYGRYGAGTDKPLVMVSPTAENTHPEIVGAMAEQGVAVLRGLRPGIVALRNLGISASPPAEDWRAAVHDGTGASFAAEIAACRGVLPAALCGRILAAYGIPLVRSALVGSTAEAVDAAERIGFPLVAKIVSPDVPHRSELGGVALGIADAGALRTALEQMRRSVLAARPAARIEGFELQEELTDCVEAAAGFIAAPPFGALTMVGTGGVLVELEADRAVGLSPVPRARALEMIGRTRLGRRMAGFRKLMPPTDTAGLADLLVRLSTLAAALTGSVAECDLNPVLIRKGSGEVRVADVLMVAAGDAMEAPGRG
ncbi:MAG TPA: acetate--CoA ligase family protein [Acetobacteraceae bacterium]|nr:acetate--CoA ligase family protein [Acetobacteraceae bacterium]